MAPRGFTAHLSRNVPVDVLSKTACLLPVLAGHRFIEVPSGVLDRLQGALGERCRLLRRAGAGIELPGCLLGPRSKGKLLETPFDQPSQSALEAFRVVPVEQVECTGHILPCGKATPDACQCIGVRANAMRLTQRRHKKARGVTWRWRPFARMGCGRRFCEVLFRHRWPP